MVNQSKQRLLARAQYDNIAETPDELAFKKGDIITVIEQETGGLEGWWLCALRGKQGIAPGNRLKLMPGTTVHHERSQTADYPSPTHDPVEWNRRSWDGSSNKVMTPQRRGDLFVYGQPKPGQDYDVPPTRYPDSVSGSLYNTPSSAKSSREELDQSASFEQSLYDTPPQSRSIRSPDSSMYDTPPSHLHLDPFNIPSSSVRTSLASKLSDESIMSFSSGISNGNSKSNSASMCDSARSSLDISPLDMYDVPPTQKEREMRALYQIRNSKDSGLDMYDSPPKLKSPPSLVEDYDVPKLSSLETERAKRLNDMRLPLSEPSSPGSFLDDYDVPKHNSRPFDHLMPQTIEYKTVSPALDEYDVPKKHDRPVANVGRSNLPKRQRSLDTLLDYDTPKSNPQASRFSMDDNLCSKEGSSDCSFSQKLHSEISDDENSYDEPDAAPVVKKVLDVKPKLEKQDHAVDDMYDSPKNNAPVKNMSKEFTTMSIDKTNEPKGVYDIPPQVTRDSMVSSRSDCSIISYRSDSSDGTDGQRLSQCSIDSRDLDLPLYDELPLDLDAANELVIKLQQDVQKATNKLSSFVTSSWRKRDNLIQKLDDMRCAIVGVEHALGEFVDFGQGTLANSAKLSDRKLISKLSKYLIPLQQALQQIRVCIKHLNDAEWQIPKLMPQESAKRDDLGQIWSCTKDLYHDVKKLAGFIQGNSSLLFKRAKDFQHSSRNSGTLTPSGKPPISRKPPALPSKTLQARPLPAPPPTERPLPPTPTEKKSQDFGFSGPDSKRFSGEFKRHSGEYKHWSGEFQVKRLSVERSTPEKEVDGLLPEYDYVQLDDEKEQDASDSKKYATEIDKKTEMEKKVHSSSHESLLEKVVEVNERDCKDFYKSADSKVEQNSTESELIQNKDEIVEKEKVSGTKSEAVIQEEINVNIPERDTEQSNVLHLDPSDRQVLLFYSEQMDTHSTLLTNSIDAFFNCIESNQGPKVFISNSKFVVVSAHKLVYIGDSLHHNLQNEEVRTKIIQSANNLCDCLKLTVMATKTAALQYPSIPAVQEMVDRVVDVSHSASMLKQLVVQASKL